MGSGWFKNHKVTIIVLSMLVSILIGALLLTKIFLQSASVSPRVTSNSTPSLQSTATLRATTQPTPIPTSLPSAIVTPGSTLTPTPIPTFSNTPTPTPSASANWKVSTDNNNVLQIAYGTGTNTPQYGALDQKSAYFRLNYGPASGWGTSIILLPSLWSKTACPTDYCQGAPVDTTWSIDGLDLLLTLNGTIANLQVTTQVRLSPPTSNSISAQVKTTITGNITLDSDRPGEAFKPVFLDSMHISATQWDSQKAYANSQFFNFPSQGWIIQPPVTAQKFGLQGGTSSWKTNAPTVEVQLQNPMQITGWVTLTANPNDDNIGYWCATSSILTSWSYTVTALP